MAKERIFNFMNIFSEVSEYTRVKDELKKEILYSYGSRHDPAKIILNDGAFDATLGRVLINLLIMKPFVEKGLKLCKNDLFNYESVTEDSLNEYFNNILTRFKRDVNFDFDDLRILMADTINELSDISGVLNVLSGNSVSFHDFVRLISEGGRAKELFTHKIGPRQKFSEIEEGSRRLSQELVDYFSNNPETELYPFVKSGTGINKMQFGQALGYIGLKPDIDGSIIPVAIEDNYLYGLSNIENYFINAKGTRKALITNSKMVRRSGYLTRKLSLLMVDRFHDNNFADCNTDHFVIFNIETKAKLYQLEGRHYYDLDAENQKISELKTIDLNDESLIGKTVGLRSPITCAGSHVCKTCYGSDLSEVNRDLNSGLLAVVFLTNVLTQMLLSAKHLLTTRAEKINWGSKFEEVFDIDMNSLYFKTGEEYQITFSADFKKDEESEESYINELTVSTPRGRKLFDYSIPEEETKIYVDEIELRKHDAEFNPYNQTYSIQSANYSEDDPVFTFETKNNELTKSLEQIISLIETVDHLGQKTYHDMVNKFSDLLIENRISMDSIHAEMIVSNLIRDVRTKKRLDFSKKSIDEYYIARVSKSIMDGPLAGAIAFERIEEQLTNLDTYEKDEESLLDYLFR